MKQLTTTNHNVTLSNFDFNVYNQQLISSNLADDYVFAALSASATLTIDNVDFTIFYETGNVFHHNNYNLPANVITFASEQAGGFMTYLIEAGEAIDSDNYETQLAIDYASDLGIEITASELLEIYLWLRDEIPHFEDFGISDVPATY